MDRSLLIHPMAIALRLYPTGTIGPHEAILRIARSSYPEHWHEGAMLKDEILFWKRPIELPFCMWMRREFIQNFCILKKETIYKTYKDYGFSYVKLRQCLLDGIINAYIKNDSGKNITIESSYWLNNYSEDVLLSGYINKYGDSLRILLIDEKKFSKLFENEIHFNCDPQIPSGRPPSVRELEHWYQARILKFENLGIVPTLDEDESDAKTSFPGVTRAMVRTCRNKFAPSIWSKSGPRGKRKPNSAAKSADNSADD